MALTSNDFSKGIDFTGLSPSAAAGDHNTLVDLATCVVDSANEGKSIIVWTTDSALNTPIVPNAASITKWKNYLWSRRPYVTVTTRPPVIYVWDDSAASDPTLLKWKVYADQTVALAAIVVLTSRVAAVEVAVSLATDVANSSVALASNANSTANDAIVTALIASADANTAVVRANTAYDLAGVADTKATGATDLANAASTVAGTANTNASSALSRVVNVEKTQSADFAFTLNSNIVPITHGFGATPKSVRWVVYCAADDVATGHLLYDEIPLEYIRVYGGGGDLVSVPACLPWATPTELRLRISAINPIITHATTGADAAFTIANWRLRCYYSKN